MFYIGNFEITKIMILGEGIKCINHMIDQERRNRYMKVLNIKWDTDGDMELLEQLPTEMDIPEGIMDEEEISDYLTDETGFCHYGFELVD